MVDFNGDQYLAGILNSGVHVLMYSHYFVSVLGKDTPWRKALTSMQLVQFVLNVSQHSYALWRGEEDCPGSPYCVRVIMVVYFIIQFLLFAHFYRKSYGNQKPVPSPVLAMEQAELERRLEEVKRNTRPRAEQAELERR